MSDDIRRQIELEVIEMEAIAFVISHPDFEADRIEQYITHLDAGGQQYVLKMAGQFARLDQLYSVMPKIA